METRMKIIIDTDPGVDDAFALCYASRCPELDIQGITTTYGNNYIGQTTDNGGPRPFPPKVPPSLDNKLNFIEKEVHF
ncbi:nucleoside hydrolase [Salmonella enterica subsp. enterica serovar Java]|nr:nucleoside hydrolase [Salmonella enterica subsp. enterica serovar Java]EDX3987526.1 nucleoside hydrolase [Salmonella enterica subsp. enterica serovar 4,[5],12:b:-]EHG9610935.1 nucleoside hydrolase [Salmonella enterica]